MTQLVNSTPQEVSAGIKNISMRMSSGSAVLQMSIDGAAFADIEDSSKTASANFNITVPECRLQAVLTGDATVNFANIS